MEDSQVLDVFTRFKGLSENERKEKTCHPKLSRFSDRAKAIYLDLARNRNQVGEGEFVVPVMVLARMLGYEYEKQYHFIDKVCKNHGTEGVDYKALQPPLIFKHHLEVMFKIPGTNDHITFTKTRGNHKYFFATLPFVWKLAVRGQGRLCNELAELTIVMHNLLADKVEEVSQSFQPIKGIKQTNHLWQSLRGESRYITVTLQRILNKIGGPKLCQEVNQYMNQQVVGVSSAYARSQVEGMRKGESVRNVIDRPLLLAMREIQGRFCVWLEDLEEEDKLPTYEKTVEHLHNLTTERQHILKEDRAQPLLKHPGLVINKNGSINPAGYKRARAALESGSSDPPHLLAEQPHARKKRITPKENPLMKYGFVPLKATT